MRNGMATMAMALAALLGLAEGARAQGAAFEFVAMGDVPYRPEDMVKLDRLIGAVNRLKPAFSVHVGDFKGGGEKCSDEAFQRILDKFNAFDGALVYTPGDNEWTDCHRQGDDPLERLAKLRAMFFAEPTRSLGRAPLTLLRQSEAMKDKHGKFVENARFEIGGVVFVTAHVVGSNNNLEGDRIEAFAEALERDRATVAWIDEAFAHAGRTGAKAAVVMMQAYPYALQQAHKSIPRASGHVRTVQAVARGARAFGKPVLVVQGDEHVFELTPLLGSDLDPVPGALRLQVPGDRDVHAVRVGVDPADPAVFSFRPLVVPENGKFGANKR